MYKVLLESVRLCKRYDKNIWCVFRFTVLTAVHLQKANVKFHKVVYRHTVKVKWKTFTILYDKFTRDNMYKTLSKLVRFCRRYDRKHFVVFFSVHSVVTSCELVRVVTHLCFRPADIGRILLDIHVDTDKMKCNCIHKSVKENADKPVQQQSNC